MTIQTKLNRKQGFRQELKKLAKVGFFLAVFLLSVSFGNVNARTPQEAPLKIELLSAKITAQTSVSLTEPASGPSLSLDIDPTFAANYPSAVFTANMESDNQTIALTVLNAPSSGRQDVGTVSVTDSSGAEIALVTVKLKDGILEGSLQEF